MSLITRATNIVMRPNAEWPAIAADPATPASIFAGYVVPLAAIAPITSFVGFSIVGVGIPFVATYRVGLVAGVTDAVISYVFALLGVLVLTAIVNVLAPSFGAQKFGSRALKVAAYALTPSFLAGIFLIYPPLGILGIIASLYTIYLIFLGLRVVMGASSEKAPIYAVSVIACAIVVGVVFGAANAVVRVGTYAATGALGAHAGSTDTSVAQSMAASAIGSALGGSAANREAAQQTVNAVASAAARADVAEKTGDENAQAAAGLGMLKAFVTGGKSVAVVPRAELKTLLPAQVGDMRRVDARSESGTFAGIKGSKAVANFKGPGGTIAIEVSDLGNVRGLASLAGAAANLSESEDDEGYEKTVDVGGQKVHESWKNATKHSELLGLVDSRFSIDVTGDGVVIDRALEAFRTIDIDKLRGLAAQTK
ncbi:MAG: DUF1282 family protein [Candidatus Eremiobacteraeota bacterium]|nr:DUF1282 family protein [Candidatus Eremiobacteraeota bacterium]